MWRKKGILRSVRSDREFLNSYLMPFATEAVFESFDFIP